MPLKSQARGTKPRPNSDTARCQSLWLQSTRARKIMLFVSHFLSFFAPFFPSSSSCSHGLFADGFWLCNALNSFVSSLFLFCGVFVFCLFVCLFGIALCRSTLCLWKRTWRRTWYRDATASSSTFATRFALLSLFLVVPPSFSPSSPLDLSQLKTRFPDSNWGTLPSKRMTGSTAPDVVEARRFVFHHHHHRPFPLSSSFS